MKRGYHRIAFYFFRRGCTLINADFLGGNKYGPINSNEITSKTIGSAYEVSNYLGVGFLEKVYENALKIELELKNLTVENQKQIFIFYKEEEVGRYQIDLLVDKKVIVEVKNNESILPIHKAQLVNYLKATGLLVGLIINFGKPKVEFQRIVLEKNNPRYSGSISEEII